MSMNELFNLAGAKPKQITPYTTGTGTYVPTVDMARCFVRVQAGGGGGWSSIAGGGGGAMIEFWIRVPIAGLAYVVGAGGAATVGGSASSFGQFIANPGTAGTGTSVPGKGGILAVASGLVNATHAQVALGGSLSGVNGGHGGEAGSNGGQVGTPYGAGSYQVSSSPDTSNGVGNGSGGDSFYGHGGASGSAPAATAYGAGGGANAAGRIGYIEVWDFGA